LWSIVEVDARDPPAVLRDDRAGAAAALAQEEECDEPVEWLAEEEFEPPQPTSKVPNAVVTILDTEALQARRHAAVSLLAELANIPVSRARAALRRCAWDLDIAVAKLPCITRTDTSVTESDQSQQQQQLSDDSTFECPCCMDDVAMADTRSLSCGHRFCVGCWRRHVELGIREGRARRLCCMATSCSDSVDTDLVREVVSEAFLQRYEEAMLGAFVEENKHAKWCPSAPACGNAAVVDLAFARVAEVHCRCGLDWCFRCRTEAHFPATCEMAEAWRALLVRGVIENAWIREHTKQCPACRRRIEKVYGCDLVTCPCGQPFCWKCGGPTGFDHTWDSIAGHTCEEWLKKKKAMGGPQQPLQELPQDSEDRFSVASELHQAHIFSREAMSAIAATHAKAKAELATAGMAFSPRHLAALDAALAMLVKAKRVLAWSHVFLFFAFRTTKTLPPAFSGGWDVRHVPNKTLNSLSLVFQAYQGRLNDAVAALTDEVSAQVPQLASWDTIDKLIAHTAKMEAIILSFYDLLHVKLAEYFPSIATTVAVPSVTK